MKIHLVTTAVIKTEEVLVIDHGRGMIRRRGCGLAFSPDELRQDRKARIVTDEPERVCLALGLAYPDPQVIEN